MPREKIPFSRAAVYFLCEVITALAFFTTAVILIGLGYVLINLVKP